LVIIIPVAAVSANKKKNDGNGNGSSDCNKAEGVDTSALDHLDPKSIPVSHSTYALGECTYCNIVLTSM
ncbi:hypothetical protein ACTXP8_27545, partial [Klebsiella pneumoniae]|uniref:hypothetical protein n=1 Tax=Klebsiella pneumoniae TaxID=573 RepID=UPI003FD00DF4